MRRAIFPLLLSGLLLVAGLACAGDGQPTPAPSPTPTPTPTPTAIPPAPPAPPGGGPLMSPQVDPRLTHAQTAFGLEALRRLAHGEPDANVFISPSSIAFALAMTYNGAEGETRQAMARVLELHGMTLEEANQANLAWLQALAEAEDGVEVSLANSLWVREGVPVQEGFLARVREHYQAEVAHLDFGAPEAADTINAWVDQQTRGRIEDIVEPPIDADTLLFLINAVYFKGQWQAPFDPERTSDGRFTLSDGAARTVPMMSREGTYEVRMGDGPQAVRLPYGEEGRFAMYVFLPAEGSDVGDLLQQLDADTWEDWTSGFSAGRVILQMPRFTLEYEVSLNDTLKAMGMEVAFDPHRADFTEMVPREWMEPENVYIKDVKHKTFLEVNEEGTEAAAATSVEMGLTSLPPSFTVDRPFLVAIQDDETGIVLFAGVVVDPAP